MDKDVPPKPESGQLCMNPLDLRIIRRLSERVNVLPIIARSDTLTDEKLNVVKEAVSRELARTKLGFGVFGTPRIDEEPLPANVNVNGSPAAPKSTPSISSRSVKSNSSASRPQTEDEGDSGEEVADESGEEDDGSESEDGGFDLGSAGQKPAPVDADEDEDEDSDAEEAQIWKVRHST